MASTVIIQLSSVTQSCPNLCNPMNRGAWWATVHGVVKSWIWLKQLSSHTHITNICFYKVRKSIKLSVQFSCSVVSDSLRPQGSKPGLPVHHKHPEITQTHVHWVSDDIQPSHPLPSPSLPAFSLSQHQGLFQWVSSSYQVARETWWNYNSTQLYGIIITTLEINNKRNCVFKSGIPLCFI